MSRTQHARKVAWNKRWPGHPCIQFKLLMPNNQIVEGLLRLQAEQANQIFAILFPKKEK